MASQAATFTVLDRLRELYGGLYNEQNVALSGTHTHGGPAGETGGGLGRGEIGPARPPCPPACLVPSPRRCASEGALFAAEECAACLMCRAPAATSSAGYLQYMVYDIASRQGCCQAGSGWAISWHPEIAGLHRAGRTAGLVFRPRPPMHPRLLAGASTPRPSTP